jgi:hypothetical protein
VLDGTAAPELLETYDAERRPVGSFTVEQAYTRYVLRLDPGLGKENLMPIVSEATVELGYRYASDAISVEDRDDGAMWENPAEPTGRPGMRAPHAAVERGGEAVSTLDLFGRGFVVLAGPEGGGWCDAARAEGARLGVPVDGYRLGADVLDGSGRVAALYGVGVAGAVLVRPDGFIAWRAREVQDGEDGALEAAIARAVARPAPA